MKILNRFTAEVIFESEKTTIRETVLEAISKKADLSKANLSKANLSWADLSKADLSEANLSKADLSKPYTWKTEFYKAKVTEKVKQQIIDSFKFVVVKE